MQSHLARSIIHASQGWGGEEIIKTIVYSDSSCQRASIFSSPVQCFASYRLNMPFFPSLQQLIKKTEFQIN